MIKHYCDGCGKEVKYDFITKDLKIEGFTHGKQFNVTISVEPLILGNEIDADCLLKIIMAAPEFGSKSPRKPRKDRGIPKKDKAETSVTAKKGRGRPKQGQGTTSGGSQVSSGTPGPELPKCPGCLDIAACTFRQPGLRPDVAGMVSCFEHKLTKGEIKEKPLTGE